MVIRLVVLVALAFVLLLALATVQAGGAYGAIVPQIHKDKLTPKLYRPHPYGGGRRIPVRAEA